MWISKKDLLLKINQLERENKELRLRQEQNYLKLSYLGMKNGIMPYDLNKESQASNLDEKITDLY